MDHDDVEISFRDVLEARRSGDREALNRISLLRAYQPAKELRRSSFGLMTASRITSSPEENQKRRVALLHELRSIGCGIIRLRGHSGGSAVLFFFVGGLSLHHAKRLRKKYEQDVVIFLGAETEHHVHVLRDGETEDLGEFDPGKIASGYSSAMGTPFHFEWVANSWGEAMIQQHDGRRGSHP